MTRDARLRALAASLLRVPGLPPIARRLAAQIASEAGLRPAQSESPSEPPALRHPHQTEGEKRKFFSRAREGSPVTRSSLNVKRSNFKFLRKPDYVNLDDPWGDHVERTTQRAATRPARSLPRAQLPETEWYPLFAEATTLVIGRVCPPETDLGRKARDLATRRFAEGFTSADLLRACRCAAARWNAGERWPALRNFGYVWGASMASVLAAGDGRPTRQTEAPQHRAGAERDEWERGLAAAPALPDPSMLLGGDTGSVGEPLDGGGVSE